MHLLSPFPAFFLLLAFASGDPFRKLTGPRQHVLRATQAPPPPQALVQEAAASPPPGKRQTGGLSCGAAALLTAAAALGVQTTAGLPGLTAPPVKLSRRWMNDDEFGKLNDEAELQLYRVTANVPKSVPDADVFAKGWMSMPSAIVKAAASLDGVHVDTIFKGEGLVSKLLTTLYPAEVVRTTVVSRPA